MCDIIQKKRTPLKWDINVKTWREITSGDAMKHNTMSCKSAVPEL
jgi:hypothetical protein